MPVYLLAATKPAPRRGLSLAVLLAAMIACARPEPDEAMLADQRGRPPNVLLITVDTLRADHLGAYGYPRPTSPEIDALAAEGVLFTDALTPVPTTAPALAALLTGRHIDEHGVRDNHATLPESLATIGEAFATAGYETAGFYGNGAVRAGFGQGLGVFEPFGPNWFFDDSAGTAKAIAWLRRAKQPWFLWVHYMNPHGPYRSSPSERSAGLTFPDTPELVRQLPLAPGNYALQAIPKYQRLRDRTRIVDYLRRYDGEIIGTDLEIGALRRELEGSGLLRRTLIVLTADHGESLGEEGYYFQHGHFLNQASLRVPLILSHALLPQGRQLDLPVSLLDVFPTVATLAGLRRPEGGAGQDLTAALRDGASGAGPERDRSRMAYTVTSANLVSVRRGRFELQGSFPQGGTADKPENLKLLDHASAPPQSLPIGSEPQIRAELQRELRLGARQVRRPPPGASAPSGRKTRAADEKRLRALGYID